jgi:RecA-family ATPase
VGDLGRYAEGFASWRKVVGGVPPETRMQTFEHAAHEVADFVSRGLDRVSAADELQSIAEGAGLLSDDAGTNAVQEIIARAFEQIEIVPSADDVAEERAYTNGKHRGPKEEEPPPLPLIDIRQWQSIEPKPRQWLVRDRIPARNVTLLTGQGGVGKTLLMQQLSVATVIGRDWIGEMPEPGPVLFITAEDDEDEMHFRYTQIAKFYGASFNDLADLGLHLLSLAGKDAAIAVADNRGIVRPTKLFGSLQRTARELRPRWICLDTAADIFIVNERDRSQVRQCVSLLRGICIEINTAVLLLAHPSLSGISSGTGLSGSTAWHNSVRSRMYLKTEKVKDDDVPDDDQAEVGTARVLEFMKSNYSALALPVRLTWKDGLLVVPKEQIARSGPARAALDRQAQELFLQLLASYNQQDRALSHKPRSNNYAPTVFAELPETKVLAPTAGARKRLFREALDRLFNADQVYLDGGPKREPASRRFLCLYRRADLPLQGGKLL